MQREGFIVPVIETEQLPSRGSAQRICKVRKVYKDAQKWVHSFDNRNRTAAQPWLFSANLKSEESI
jgi:hypothetical protein